MSNPDFSALRAAMVASQLRTNAITNADLLVAMEAIPREEFVPEGKDALAYVDVALPLSNGRALPAPLATARLIQELGSVSGARVLLIGAGTGYAAALLGQMGAIVTAVEEDAQLVDACRKNAAGRNLELVSGTLVAGALREALYDALLLDGAVAFIPDALLAQLKEGALISTGLIEAGVTRIAKGKVAGGKVALVSVVDMEIPALPGFATLQGFAF